MIDIEESGFDTYWIAYYISRISKPLKESKSAKINLCAFFCPPISSRIVLCSTCLCFPVGPTYTFPILVLPSFYVSNSEFQVPDERLRAAPALDSWRSSGGTSPHQMVSHAGVVVNLGVSRRASSPIRRTPVWGHVGSKGGRIVSSPPATASLSHMPSWTRF